MRKILLTGGNGMVGRNIREHPGAAGWTVLAPGRAELDLRDEAATLDYVSRHVPDIIVHAAGTVGGIHANIARPVDFLVDNLDMGRNIIMAARTSGVPHLLNLASSAMYPRNAPNPLQESLVLTGALDAANEGYALAKIVATRLCEYIRRGNPEFAYKTLILCNLYGRHDKFSPEHSHLIASIIHKIEQAKATGQREVDIWGDGTARREFMYGTDLAEAVWQAIETIDGIPDVMNIGLGYDYTITEYYEHVAKIAGWSGTFVYDETKPVGMKKRQVDISRQTAWGWCPKYSLKDGLAETYQFYLDVVR